MIPIPGKELSGVVGGIEFLRDAKSGKPTKVRDRVVVIGGGNVAVDCARTALRIGAKEVHLVCLESKQEMPANTMEIAEALAENVILHASWGPGEIIGVSGKAGGVVFQKCIAVFDEQRNFNPRCDIAKTTKIVAEMVILAVGQEPDLFFLGRDDQVRTTNVNTVGIEQNSLSTEQPGVFSGGDCVTGPATFIEAIAHGNKAALKIDQYLRTGKFEESDQEKLAEWFNRIATKDQRDVGFFSKIDRQNPTLLSPEERKKGLAEVESAMTKEAVLEETQRCLRCYRLMVLVT
jgi:NADPH-dependent glutamate synthase beta subunit-like oxidoreductase